MDMLETTFPLNLACDAEPDCLKTRVAHLHQPHLNPPGFDPFAAEHQNRD